MFRSIAVPSSIVLLGASVSIAIALVGCATGNDSRQSPEATAERFIQLDFDGARLSPSTQAQIEPYVTWKSQPVWETFYIVSGFDITNSRVSGDDAEVDVAYNMLGKAEAATWRLPASPDPSVLAELQRNSGIVLKLHRTRDGWRITDPVFFPHVSPEALESHIRRYMQWEKDDRLKAVLAYLDTLERP